MSGRIVVRRVDGAFVLVNGESDPYLSFCSNDYLGLSRHPAVRSAMVDGLSEGGVGACSSRRLAGYHPVHRQLEIELADFLGLSDAVLFSSGFLAVQGAVDSVECVVGSRRARFVLDELAHASGRDAAARSKLPVQTYRHLDAASLRSHLNDGAFDANVVMTDGVFSATGEIAPVGALASAARESGATFVLDDAHGIGTIGKAGRGAMEVERIERSGVDLLIGTLSKALGAFGGFVAGSDEAVNQVREYARSYTYSTAPPPALAQAALASLDIVRREAWRRDALADRINYFQGRARDLGVPVRASSTPIQITNADERVGRALARKRILARQWPPSGSGLLRVGITLDHEREHLDRLLECLAENPS